MEHQHIWISSCSGKTVIFLFNFLNGHTRIQNYCWKNWIKNWNDMRFLYTNPHPHTASFPGSKRSASVEYLTLLLGMVWVNESRIHLPDLEGGSDCGLSGIVKQEQSSWSIDCHCWVNPRRYNCPSTLGKALYYGMVHLHSFQVTNHFLNIYIQINQHVYVFNLTLNLPISLRKTFHPWVLEPRVQKLAY